MTLNIFDAKWRVIQKGWSEFVNLLAWSYRRISNITAWYSYAVCRYADCRNSEWRYAVMFSVCLLALNSVIMFNFILFSVVILNFIMISVIMENVLAPQF